MKLKSKEDYYSLTGYFFLGLLVFVPSAFYKNYFSIFPDYVATTKNDFVIHFHAFATSTWLLLLIVQPILIRYKKHDLHRMLGKFTYFFFPLVFGSFISLMYAKSLQPEIADYGFFGRVPLRGGIVVWLGVYMFYFQIIHVTIFTTCYILAVINKHKVALHAGYMIGTGLMFINPIIRRFGMFVLGMSFTAIETIILIGTELIIIGLLLYAKRNKLKYKFYFLILGLYLLYHIPMFFMMYYFFPGEM